METLSRGLKYSVYERGRETEREIPFLFLFEDNMSIDRLSTRLSVAVSLSE